MRKIFLCVVLSSCCSLSLASGQEASGQQAAGDLQRDESVAFLDHYRARAIERWEKDIQQLEALNSSQEHSAQSILFLGSSSIRRWDEIAIDMAPYHPIRRGYGGAKYSDVAVFSERLIHPHRYWALVMFVGNDVSGKPDDHTPEEVERLVRHIVGVSQRHQEDAAVLLIEVTPSGKRFDAWPKIREVNARLREIALTTANTYFIATAGDYLDPNGQPRSELFVEDQLHLNSDGYDLWSTLIRRRLDDVLRMSEQFRAKK
jgi:hypothetical protein